MCLGVYAAGRWSILASPVFHAGLNLAKRIQMEEGGKQATLLRCDVSAS